MCRNKNFIMYFSGFSNARLEKMLNFVRNGVRIDGICFNYLDVYIMTEKTRNNFMKTIEELKEYGVGFFCDSGCFPILYVYDRLSGSDVRTPRSLNKHALDIVQNNKYDILIESYISFLKEYGDLFDFKVEFDLQKIVGEDKVWKWRDMFNKNDIPINLVIHAEHSKDDIEKMVEFVNYNCGGMSLAGPRSTHPSVFSSKERQASIVKKINKDIWIHFLGFGEIKYIGKFIGKGLIQSADNTSWVNSTMFGHQYIFDCESGIMRKLSVGRIFKDKGWVKRMNLVKNRFYERYDKLVEWGFDVKTMEELFTKERISDSWNWFTLLEYQEFYNFINTEKGFNKICGSAKNTQTLDKWF